jgi:ferrous iron transport protein B
VLRGETMPLVMELPPYRVPTFRGLLIHMWERAWLYMKKAGTVILAISVVLWALTSYPKKSRFDQDYAARQERAEEAYVSGVQRLAEPLGMGGQAGLLARAELERAAAAERFYPREAGYQEAGRRYEAAMGELRAGPGGSRLARLLEFRREVDAIRREFAEEVARHRVGLHSPAYFALSHRREERLAKLQAADRGAYAAAVAYLDEVEPAFSAEERSARHAKAAEALAYSAAGRIGRAIEPALRPLGFDWKIGTALLGALGAREVFIAQMGIVSAVGSGEENLAALRQRLRADYPPLVGLCIMLFVAVSMLCVPTLAVIRRESGSWKWVLFEFAALTSLAYVLTLIVYQAGRALGIGL